MPGSSVASAPTVKPTYEIKETAEAFGLTVYLPGVAKDGLELTAEDGQVVRIVETVVAAGRSMLLTRLD